MNVPQSVMKCLLVAILVFVWSGGRGLWAEGSAVAVFVRHVQSDAVFTGYEVFIEAGEEAISGPFTIAQACASLEVPQSGTVFVGIEAPRVPLRALLPLLNCFAANPRYEINSLTNATNSFTSDNVARMLDGLRSSKSIAPTTAEAD